MKKGKPLAQGRTAEIFEWGESRVIKLLREGFSPWALEREAAVTRAIHRAGMPVPMAYDVVEVEGRRGVVFELVSGPSLLREMLSGRVSVPDAARLLADLHSKLHESTLSDLPPLKARLEREVRVASPISEELRRAALDALGKLPDGNSVCHGDFHPDNVIMSPRGPVIIDWNNAARGNPLADVAKTLVLVRAGPAPPGTPENELLRSARLQAAEIYLDRYIEARRASRQEIEVWMLPVAIARMSENIPGEREPLMAIIGQVLRATP